MIKIALSREVIKCANIWIRPTHPPEQNQQWLQGWGELHPQEKAHPDSQSIGCARVVAISGNQFENLWILKWKLDEAIKMYPSKFRGWGTIISPPPPGINPLSISKPPKISLLVSFIETIYWIPVCVTNVSRVWNF